MDVNWSVINFIYTVKNRCCCLYVILIMCSNAKGRHSYAQTCTNTGPSNPTLIIYWLPSTPSPRVTWSWRQWLTEIYIFALNFQGVLVLVPLKCVHVGARCESFALSASGEQTRGEPQTCALSVHCQGPVARGYRVAKGWMDRLASPKF